MDVSINQQLLKFFKSKVTEGIYGSVDEAIDAALRIAVANCCDDINKKKIPEADRFNYVFYEDDEIPGEFSFPKFENPLVSIVIPVYNQYNYTLKCLWSVLQQAQNIPYEIIIADDNSTDETKNIAEHIHNIKISRNRENLGYIKNCNTASKLATGKYLYFLNNDTVVQPDWLSELLNVFEIRKDAGVVGSKVILSNFKLQECGVYMYKDQFRCDYNGDPVNSMNNYLKEADYVSGCSLMTIRKLFNEIGGFDELFSPAYCDDPDYCLSVLHKGYKIYVQPKSKIIHYKSISYNSNSQELMDRNNIKLWNKWKDYFETRARYDFYKLPFTGKKRPATILVIDSFMPEFDKHAGAKTIYQFLELFASKGLNVKYCPYHSYDKDEPYYSIITNMGIQIIPKEDIRKYLQKMVNYIDYLFLSRPDVACKFLNDYYKRCNAKILFYGHDLHHLRMQRELDNLKQNRIDNCQITDSEDTLQEKIKKMKSLEKSLLEFADFSYYPSSIEENYIKKNFNIDKVKTITPYLYKTSEIKKHANFENSKDIIFVGSCHGPNKTGLLWFIDNVFDKIAEKVPDIKLNIVGSYIDDDIKNRANDNINAIGFLTEEELEKLYLKTKITIAPLLYGAGIKGKIVNSLFYSTPVVTTSIGAEGIETKYGNIYIADDADDFAKQIIDLYTDEELWNSNPDGYKEIIAKEYSFEKAWDVFKEQIDISPRNND